MEKWMQYAAKINAQISEMFDEESENYIDTNELNNEDNLKAFLHALSTVSPCFLFNKLVSEEDEKDVLTFNHMANSLCFEFSQTEN